MVMTNHNWLFISVSFLIILGGIGFPILVNFKDIVLYHLRHFWKFVRTRKLERHKVSHLYNLNTRIVLIMTFLLLVTGTLAIAAFEWNASFAGMPVADKWTQAFFNATCPRTAGFSSVDLAFECTDFVGLFSADVDWWWCSIYCRWGESECFCSGCPESCGRVAWLGTVEVFGRNFLMILSVVLMRQWLCRWAYCFFLSLY